jgi:5-methylcytosine-specific restriction endonuclease McrA
MPKKKKKKRDYKKEYRRDHSSTKAKKARAARNKANRKLKPGKGKEVDHIIPLSMGGSNLPSNWRVVSRRTNRKKATRRK